MRQLRPYQRLDSQADGLYMVFQIQVYASGTCQAVVFNRFRLDVPGGGGCSRSVAALKRRAPTGHNKRPTLGSQVVVGRRGLHL